MHRMIPVFLLCQILVSFGQNVSAGDYDECRVSCDNDFAACYEQLPAVTALNTGLLAEKEAECRQKVEAVPCGVSGASKE